MDSYQPISVDDSVKTRDELLAELQHFRHQVAELQAARDGKLPHAVLPDNHLLRAILANVPIIVFALDRNGIIMLSQGKGLELLGLKPGELVGQSILEVYRQVPHLEDDLRRALAGESFSLSIEIGGLAFEFWHTPFRNREGKTIGVAGIGMDITQRQRAEEELLAGRRLMQRMLHSHERDRQLIAYEIHDGLVQDATGAQMQLETLLQSDRLPRGAARNQVQLAADLVRKAVHEARRLMSGLRPPILDELGVVAAIEYLVEGGQQQGPSIKFTAQVQFDRLEPLLEATVYRIVQEAIANAKRHSRSDRAEVRLTQVGDRIHIEVEDWGIGFDPASVTENRFGLQGIRERARLLRGRASIDSAPGKGTRVSVDLPVADALQEASSASSWSIE